MIWEVLDTGRRSVSEIMQIDAELLDSLGGRTRPLLHLYEWENRSATYGYFTDPAAFLDLVEVERQGISLARRPTGGGIVFHLWDMAFSLLVPASCPEFSRNTLENYVFVNRAVLGVAEEFLRASPTLTPADFPARDTSCSHFCMAKPTKYDVVWQGRKIAGAAQRRTKAGFLHQGTLSLIMPPEEQLKALLLPGTEVLAAMRAFTLPLLGFSSEEEMPQAKEKLRMLLTTQLNLSSLKCRSNF